MRQLLVKMSGFGRKFSEAVSLSSKALIAVIAIGIATPALAQNKAASIVIDAKTGKVLHNSNADAPRFPASLTKMMTVYLMFEALETRRISKDSRITFSKKAASEPPTKLGIGTGKSITVEQAILALITRSANDVATATAEFLGGTEAGFAKMMTAKARQLGMKSTVYQNAHGLPNSAQRTTARDMATLGIALREHFPQYYSYFSTRSFTFGKQQIGNHNRLLGAVNGVDGIKTGYTNASGFNIVTSVRRDGRSVVAVVMGGPSAAARDKTMNGLISKHLPSASTGRDKQLVARGPAVVQPNAAAMVASILPNRAPIPAERPDYTMVAAYNNAALSADHDELANLVAESLETGDLDPVQTSSLSKWVIQVGSVPSQNDASRLLSNMRDQAGTVLAAAEPFTQVFEHKGTTFYRVRFGGFNDKTAAWKACDSLKRQKIDCFAVQN